MIRSLVVALAVILGSSVTDSSPLLAQKTDLVTLLNGDKITGEIKRMERGRLQYSTDDMGTLNIEWEKIEQLTSTAHFEVELRSGVRYFGAFEPGADPGVVIVALEGRDTLSIASIVRITPIESSLWEGLEGFVDLGFSYTQANKATTSSSSARVRFRGRRWGGTLEGGSYFQSQEDVETTSRGDVSFSLERFFGQRGWSALLFASGEQNDELNLALRSNFGVSWSRLLVQSNSSLLQIGTGVVLNNERFEADVGTFGSDTTSRSAEAVFQLEWAVFRFDSPELDVLTTIDIYPSITDFGRVRSDGDLRVQYEVINDFFVGFTVFAKLDSRPPTVDDAGNTDFGAELSVGWSF